jgi:hypothetical protein
VEACANGKEEAVEGRAQGEPDARHLQGDVEPKARARGE